jgi:hypothetical protein
MSISSDALKTLIEQLAAQVGQLQTAISAADSAGIQSASDAIATTAANINSVVTDTATTEIPYKDTQIFYLSNTLTDQSNQLTNAVGASDTQTITDLGNALAVTSQNMSICVIKMEEELPMPIPPLLLFWPNF